MNEYCTSAKNASRNILPVFHNMPRHATSGLSGICLSVSRLLTPFCPNADSTTPAWPKIRRCHGDAPRKCLGRGSESNIYWHKNNTLT